MQGIVALAVERREKEDQHTQPECAANPLHIVVPELGQFVLKPQRTVREVQGKQPRSDSEQDVERDVRHAEARELAGKNRSLTPEDIGYHRS